MKNLSMHVTLIALTIVTLNISGCATQSIAMTPTGSPPPGDEPVGLVAYYLQPSDNLDIKFYYNPELNENVTIRPDGRISLQLVDEIQAAGLTPAQLDKLLTQKYGKQLKQPMLSVILRTFGGQKIYIGGEVAAPQVLNMIGDTNALQAVFEAGGFTADAKLSSVLIISKGNDNKPVVRRVNLEQALHGHLNDKAYKLRPFDIVYVPKTMIARTDAFLTHIYNFIPRNISLSFSYELHDAANND